MRARHLPLCPVLLLSLPLLLTVPAGCGGGDGSTDPEDQVDVLEFEMLANVLLSELGGIGRALVLPGGGPGCLAVNSWSDADGDGVPDDAGFVYSASGCAFTFDEGSGTTSGSVRVVDPGSAFGFSATLSGLAYTTNLNSPAQTRVITLNGQRQVAGSPSQATLTQNVQVSTTATGKPPASATETWQVVFTPASGGSLQFGLSVWPPDGTAVVTGPLTWAQSGNTVSFSLSTAVPVHFDPACQSPFPIGGEVRVQVVSGGPAGYVKVRWSSCGGEADIDWVAGG